MPLSPGSAGTWGVTMESLWPFVGGLSHSVYSQSQGTSKVTSLQKDVEIKMQEVLFFKLLITEETSPSIIHFAITK